jgi:hypothetical protein
MEKSAAIRAAIKLTERRHAIPWDEISSKSRKLHVVKARQELAYILHTRLHLTYSEIGRILDRDHSSIIYLVKTFSPENTLDFESITFPQIDSMAHGYYLVNEGGRWAKLFQSRPPACEIPSCGFDDVLEIHHFISKKLGGSDDPSNLLILCPNHHTMIHQGLVKLKPSAFPLLDIPSHLSTPSQKSP